MVANFAYDAGGWRVEKHPWSVADLTGDRRADIVGFGDRGVWVSLATGADSFQPPQRVIDNLAHDVDDWWVGRHSRVEAGPR